jgi:alpha-ketoglutarate-dependent taurine dioxygenase
MAVDQSWARLLTRESHPTATRPYVRFDAEAGETLASVSRERVRELYKEHGALLLRGFAGGLEEFRQLAVDLCPVAVQNESRNRAKLGPSQDVQSASLGTRAFPLHPELSREPWKPDAAFFYCVNPPVTGGHTTICDGVAIVRGLDPDLRDKMASRRLAYMHPARPNELQFWLGTADPDDAALAKPPPHCPYRFERIGNHVARIFTRPFLHRPMFTDELAFGNFLLFARFLRGQKFPLLDDRTPAPDEWLEVLKQISDRLTVPIEWQTQDLLILDNSRFMHGRTAITEGDGRLIATYFGYVDFAVPDGEEPPNPIWRRPGFYPPALDRTD